MLRRLKALFSKPHEATVGNLPTAPRAIDQFYVVIDRSNRWQGDVYPLAAFPEGALPTNDIPFWLLTNRTCHVLTAPGRGLKLPYLNFAAVLPLSRFVTFGPGKSIKNQVDHLVKKNESTLFLPQSPEGPGTPLVANFNLVTSVKAENSPDPSTKVLQLASPFCEHAFQKFASFFYTVGFDDAEIRSDRYIGDLVSDLEVANKVKPG